MGDVHGRWMHLCSRGGERRLVVCAGVHVCKKKLLRQGQRVVHLRMAISSMNFTRLPCGASRGRRARRTGLGGLSGSSWGARTIWAEKGCGRSARLRIAAVAEAEAEEERRRKGGAHDPFDFFGLGQPQTSLIHRAMLTSTFMILTIHGCESISLGGGRRAGSTRSLRRERGVPGTPSVSGRYRWRRAEKRGALRLLDEVLHEAAPVHARFVFQLRRLDVMGVSARGASAGAGAGVGSERERRNAVPRFG